MARQQLFAWLTLSSLALAACSENTTPTQPEAPPTGPGSEPAGATAALTATLSFRQVSAGQTHTCGVTTGDKAYCWGDNGEGGRPVASSATAARPIG
jgi:alpha-tubulin suppressor-like RCC1 family protein